MWTAEERERHDRSGLRYPSDLSDEEWRIVEPLIPPARRGGRHRSVDVRAVLNGVLYVLETGCQWRHLPKDLPPRSTVHGYLGARHESDFIVRFMRTGAEHASGMPSVNHSVRQPVALPGCRTPLHRPENVGFPDTHGLPDNLLTSVSSPQRAAARELVPQVETGKP